MISVLILAGTFAFIYLSTQYRNSEAAVLSLRTCSGHRSIPVMTAGDSSNNTHF